MAEHVYTPTWTYPGAYQQIGVGSIYRSRGDGGNNGRYDDAPFSDGTILYSGVCDANADNVMCVSDFDGEETTQDIIITVSMGKVQYHPDLVFYPDYKQMRYNGELKVTAIKGKTGEELWSRDISLLDGYHLPEDYSDYDYVTKSCYFGDQTAPYQSLSACLLPTGVLISFGYRTYESWSSYTTWVWDETEWEPYHTPPHWYSYDTTYIDTEWSGYKFVFVPYDGLSETITTSGITTSRSYDEYYNEVIVYSDWFGITPVSGVNIDNGNELLVYNSTAYLFTGTSIATQEGEYIIACTGTSVSLSGLTGSYTYSVTVDGETTEYTDYVLARNMCAIYGSTAYGCSTLFGQGSKVYGISVSGPLYAMSSEVTGNPDFYINGIRNNYDTEQDASLLYRGVILKLSSSLLTILTSTDTGASFKHYIFNTEGLSYISSEELVENPIGVQANSLLGLPATSSVVYNTAVFYSKPNAIEEGLTITTTGIYPGISTIFTDDNHTSVLGISPYYMIGSTKWFAWADGTSDYVGHGFMVLGKEYIYKCLDGTLIAYTTTAEAPPKPDEPGEPETNEFLAESNTPLNGATNVPLSSLVTITFNERPDSSSITMDNIGMVSSLIGVIPWTYIMTFGKTIVLDPWILVPEDTITVTAYNDVTWTNDDYINHLDNSPYSFSFTTGAFAIPPVLPPIKARYSNGAGRQGVLYGIQHFNGVRKGEYK